jgi:hypothetical protein
VKHTRRQISFVFAIVVVPLLGCGSDSNQPTFPDLHPVKGVVKLGGKPVNGGSIRFNPDPEKPEFSIVSEVGTDGSYTLTTVRTTDKQGERKTGAPAGKYKVTYTPLAGDQTAGGLTAPVELSAPVEVTASANDLPIELPAPPKKK